LAFLASLRKTCSWLPQSDVFSLVDYYQLPLKNPRQKLLQANSIPFEIMPVRRRQTLVEGLPDRFLHKASSSEFMLDAFERQIDTSAF
jgi:hypothetical protein